MKINMAIALIALLVFAVALFLRKRNPYDFEKEQALLREFLSSDEARRQGYDSGSMGDFAKWKKHKMKENRE